MTNPQNTSNVSGATEITGDLRGLDLDNRTGKVSTAYGTLQPVLFAPNVPLDEMLLGMAQEAIFVGYLMEWPAGVMVVQMVMARPTPACQDQPRRYTCERCGGSGQQTAGCWDGTGYNGKAGTCDTCRGTGELGIIKTLDDDRGFRDDKA